MYWLSKILRRSRILSPTSSRATFAKLEVSGNCTGAREGAVSSSALVYDKWKHYPRLYHTKNVFLSFSVGGRMLSSKADAKDDEDDQEPEDEFSELGTSAASEDVQKGNSESESEDDSLSESELGGDEDSSEEAPEDEQGLVSKEKTPRRRARSELYEAIVTSSGRSVRSVFEEWVKGRKDLSRSETSLAMFNLRKRKMYAKALQLSECLEASKQFKFVEEDYASRLDLVAKVHGLQKAEDFIKKIPESFRGELAYRTLLANCAVKQNVRKAEEVFGKMKDLKLPTSAFACDQLLLLYNRYEKKKIPNILLLMERENVKPTQLTYRILIDAKGSSGDVTGMDQIVETMKEEGIEPGTETQAFLARHYIAAGFKEKATEVMKEMEGEDLKANPWVCKLLLPLYADMGEVGEVGRIYKFCEEFLRFDDCTAAIEAWGKLKRIEEAEAVFEKLSQKHKLFPVTPFYALLKVYTENKMLTKGKDLVKRMVGAGIEMVPLTWNAVVKLFVEAGEVEKADSVLNKVTKDSEMKLMYSSYMVILEEYAKRGDIHNAEKMFLRMKKVGYTPKLRQYDAVVRAYLNAKAPAYGMRDRMRADNVFPSKPLSEQLARVDPFRKTSVSDLLD